MYKSILALALMIMMGCIHTRYNNHYSKLTPEDREYLSRV